MKIAKKNLNLLNWLSSRVRYQDAHARGAVLSDDPGSDLFEQLLPASSELREPENVGKHVLAIAIMDLHNNYSQVPTHGKANFYTYTSNAHSATNTHGCQIQFHN